MLSGSLAQQIARDTSDVIGYNVLITDDAGIVIGSGDTGRVGSFHEASVDVLRSQQAAWHTAAEAQELRGVKPGMTLPIVIDGEAIGTVGITGSPRQVRRFGLVVRRQTEILLQESLELRSRLLRERALEELVRDIGSFDPDVLDPEFLVGRAAELGFDLTLPRTVLIVEVDEPVPAGHVTTLRPELLRTLRDALGPRALVTTMTSGRFAVLPLVSTRPPVKLAALAVAAVARRHELSCRVAAGGTASGVTALHDAYADAVDALRLGRRVAPGSTTYSIEELRGHQVMAAVGQRTRARLIALVAGSLVAQADWPDLRRTLVAWCESGFNLVQTAQVLHIHRNTLIYRLEKIERLTGTPWRDHRASLTLYLACLADQLG
ncbi:sugar diacid utilization regulator [Kribbella capetownensis]|uniref:Sugar diacid utilization regulator n=1 Tax=Kribbella capetownensis TaxID=1572659 RepID=A0A4R0JIE9_9ACTN|nr:sugar diacid recognition domain-containing protein [Kribbella capetownensis]TCC46833.1 sugar diacid utilization regulator [Kribbella capetownensis]